MPQTTSPRPRLHLTRRGRLVRSALVLLLALLLVLALVSIIRSLAGDGARSAAAQSASTGTAAPADGGAVVPAEEPASPTPVTEGGEEHPAKREEIVRSGTVGDGTWTVAAPVTDREATDAQAGGGAEAQGTVHTYALRVEGGTGIDADEAATEIADVLADARGWSELEGVTFQQVATLEEAEFTISLASPPTVDELCLPARTNGLWSCRIGEDVALNSDRWLHATPTYEDLAEYRAYMINHEVGHFLGHVHVRCGGEDELAPVMLQQSIDLQGCAPNAWPADEPGR